MQNQNQALTTAAEFDTVTVGDTVTWFDGWQRRSGRVAWVDEWRQVLPTERERTIIVREFAANGIGECWNCITVVRRGDHVSVDHGTTTGAQVLAHGGTLDEFIQFRADFAEWAASHPEH